MHQAELTLGRVEHVLLEQVMGGSGAGRRDGVVGHDRVHHGVVVVEVRLPQVEDVAGPVAVAGLPMVLDDALDPGDEVRRRLLVAAGLGLDLGDDLLTGRRLDRVVDDVAVRLGGGCHRRVGEANGPLLFGNSTLSGEYVYTTPEKNHVNLSLDNNIVTSFFDIAKATKVFYCVALVFKYEFRKSCAIAASAIHLDRLITRDFWTLAS